MTRFKYPHLPMKGIGGEEAIKRLEELLFYYKDEYNVIDKYIIDGNVDIIATKDDILTIMEYLREIMYIIDTPFDHAGIVYLATCDNDYAYHNNREYPPEWYVNGDEDVYTSANKFWYFRMKNDVKDIMNDIYNAKGTVALPLLKFAQPIIKSFYDVCCRICNGSTYDFVNIFLYEKEPITTGCNQYKYTRYQHWLMPIQWRTINAWEPVKNDPEIFAQHRETCIVKDHIGWIYDIHNTHHCREKIDDIIVQF